MAIIVITKSGQSFQTRDGDKNPRGEIAGTQDLMKHLSEQGHRVIYFGVTKMTLDDMPWCRAIVRPDLSGMHQYMSSAEQQERFADSHETLCQALSDEGWDGATPPLWIESCGLSASYSFINNSRGVSPLMSSLRYTAPMLGVMALMRSPRICLVTDTRSYPRDGEMSDKWPELRPAALLDNTQHGLDREMTISFKKYRLRSCDSRSWSWPYLDWLEPCPDEEIQWDICGASHCHVGTGFKKKFRDDAWCQLLGDEGQLFSQGRDDSCVMYGEGWAHWSGYEKCGYPRREIVFKGPADYGHLMRALSVARASPVVAPVPGFVTNKPVIIASRGCLPILGQSWDPTGEIIDMKNFLRSWCWEHSLKIAKLDLQRRSELLMQLRSLFRQDFSVIDQLVADYDAGLI